MTPESGLLWALGWIGVVAFAAGALAAVRAWLRRSAALAGLTCVFVLGLAGQLALRLEGAPLHLGLETRHVAELALLGLAIAALAALRATHRTTRERDRSEDLHWDSMELVRRLTELDAGRSELPARLDALLALGAERFGLERGLAWSSEDGRIVGRLPAAHGEPALPDEARLRRVAEASRPVLEVHGAGRRHGVFFAAPARRGGRSLGSLAFEGTRRSRPRYTATDKDLLGLLAQWLAFELEAQARDQAPLMLPDPAPTPRAGEPLRETVRPATADRDTPRRPPRRSGRRRSAARRPRFAGDLNAAARLAARSQRRRGAAGAPLELALAADLPHARPLRPPLPDLVEGLLAAARRLSPDGPVRVETRHLEPPADLVAPAQIALEVRLEDARLDEGALERVYQVEEEAGATGLPQAPPLTRLESLLRDSGGDVSISVEPGRCAVLTAFLPVEPGTTSRTHRANTRLGAQPSR